MSRADGMADKSPSSTALHFGPWYRKTLILDSKELPESGAAATSDGVEARS